MKACLLLLAAVFSITLEAATAGQELVQKLRPLQSLSGLFTQVQRDSEGELMSESSGLFRVQRPGMLRWETLDPFPQLLVTNGQSLWLYDPDLEQVTVSKLTDQLNQSPAVIFSGDLARIEARFVIGRNADGGFSLKPRKTGNVFQQLDLYFEEGLLAGMLILDGFGQETQFAFSQLEQGKSWQASEFEFDAPAGTDVLIHE